MTFSKLTWVHHVFIELAQGHRDAGTCLGPVVLVKGVCNAAAYQHIVYMMVRCSQTFGHFVKSISHND